VGVALDALQTRVKAAVINANSGVGHQNALEELLQCFHESTDLRNKLAAVGTSVTLRSLNKDISELQECIAQEGCDSDCINAAVNAMATTELSPTMMAVTAGGEAGESRRVDAVSGTSGHAQASYHSTNKEWQRTIAAAAPKQPRLAKHPQAMRVAFHVASPTPARGLLTARMSFSGDVNTAELSTLHDALKAFAHLDPEHDIKVVKRDAQGKLVTQEAAPMGNAPASVDESDEEPCAPASEAEATEGSNPTMPTESVVVAEQRAQRAMLEQILARLPPIVANSDTV
jgi:hypothetical protein